MSKINDAVTWAVGIANDPSHGYDQIHRWGPDYDCSSLLITAWEKTGVKVKSAGATYTGNMRKAFLSNGFSDVTSAVNLKTGAGIQKGDIVLNIVNHTAMCIDSNTRQLVMASLNEKGGVVGGKTGDQTGGEIKVRSYYNYPWDCVLRYAGETVSPEKPAVVEKPSASGKIAADGSFGPDTVRATQKYLGVKADGIVSNQPLTNRQYLPGAYTGCWEFKNTGYSRGSAMVKALQALTGAKEDGFMGKESVAKLQKFLGITQDGNMGADTVKAWQNYLNTH